MRNSQRQSSHATGPKRSEHEFARYKLLQSRMEGPCTTLAHVRVTHHPNAGLRGHTDTQRSNLI